MRNLASGLSTFGIDVPKTPREFGIADGWLVQHNRRLLALSDMPVAGLHNAANALAAFALCSAACPDANPEKLAAGLKAFKGLPHRLENVDVIDGVTFFDDSKGTNVGSTVAALNGMTVPVVLIAGGIGKEQDFSPLVPAVQMHVRAVVLIGQDARLINDAIAAARVPATHAASMANAVAEALARAKPGDAVLLSPACSSFDMFRNYQHRGEVFAQCVRELKRQREAGHVV
jgi:UDP-N-acetylmuramoylalanine--D-glutamate ligase